MLEFYKRKAANQETLAKWHRESGSPNLAGICEEEAAKYRALAKQQNKK